MKKTIAFCITMFCTIAVLQAQITVTNPKANDTWHKLGTYSITWTWPGKINNLVLIKLFHEGAKVLDIAQNVAGGIKTWTIPEKLADGKPLAEGIYTVRVREAQGTNLGISKPFTIAAPLKAVVMKKAIPPKTVLLQDLKVVPLDKFAVNAVKKYPNPAVTQLNYQILKMVNQLSMDLKIIGTVENIGPAEFLYSGTATLYRGTGIAAQRNFAKLASRESFTIEFSVSEGFDFTSQGVSFPVDYLLKIDFTPGIQAKPEEIDGDMSNNETKLLGTTIAQDAYQRYSNNYRQQLTALINQHRQSSGLSPLTLDACISAAAQGHSEWMKNNVFSHTGKNGSDPSTRCQWSGCKCSAENIYEGGMAPSDAFNSWKNSPGHNANMLGGYTKIGIGICSGWITADFE